MLCADECVIGGAKPDGAAGTPFGGGVIKPDGAGVEIDIKPVEVDGTPYMGALL